MRFLDYEGIGKIRCDVVGTYARIVGDYQAQKKDPNHDRIPAGGKVTQGNVPR